MIRREPLFSLGCTLSVSVVECEAGIQRGDESWRLRSITYQSAVFNVQRESKSENVFGRPQSSCRPEIIISFRRYYSSGRKANFRYEPNSAQPSKQSSKVKDRIYYSQRGQ